MMKRLSKTERIAKLETAVKTHGWRRAEIARRIGTSRQNLQNVVDRDSEQSEYAIALDVWLDSFGTTNAWELRSAEQADALREIITMLRALLNSVQDPRKDPTARLDAVQNHLEGILRLVPVVRKALAQGSDIPRD